VHGVSPPVPSIASGGATVRAVEALLDLVEGLSPGVAAAVFLLFNGLILVVAVLGGALIVRRTRGLPPDRAPRSQGADPVEVGLAGVTVVVNAGVTWLGWWLWREGVIDVSRPLTGGSMAEWVALVLVMDLALYLGHRAAHHVAVYPVVHRLHHRFTSPRPLTLFALHPVETASFGGLWLVVLAVWDLPFGVVVAYGAVNLLFGTLGHLGVEPLPLALRRRRLFRWLATPSFHEGHHLCPETNLGFYTTIWDRLGGTLDPGYDTRRTGAVVG
jgi:sterol desaturase/sphingolipid hydroxylase (fatty acid hydroxylase superfamily)